MAPFAVAYRLSMIVKKESKEEEDSEARTVPAGSAFFAPLIMPGMLVPLAGSPIGLGMVRVPFARPIFFPIA